MHRNSDSSRVMKPVVTGIILASLSTAIALSETRSGAVRTTRPNIVLIVADDLGFSDLGAFGGEIDTPNIDRLAQRGLAFTHFYTAASCSPTRAMLLTGVDHHQTGFGTLAEIRQGHQLHAAGYEGYLSNRVATLPERMREVGYRTLMAGKWHLGLISESGPKARGFDRSFALAHGLSSHYSDAGYSPLTPKVDFYENGARVSLPGDFYSSDTFTDRLLGYLKEPGESRQPFFAYLAFTAPHYPLQAPQSLIEKYLPRYAQGWDEVRAGRIARLRVAGLLGKDTPAAQRPEGIPAWIELTDEQRRFEVKRMAVYAAMIERLDQNVGRLLTALEASGVANDTVVVLMSDNGAEASEQDTLPPLTPWFRKTFDLSYDAMGGAKSFVALGPAWASVAATPLAWFKGLVAEGGVRSPLIMAGPGVGHGRRGDTVTVADLAVTLLDEAGLSAFDRKMRSAGLLAPEGRSFRSLLSRDNSALPRRINYPGPVVYMESSGSAAAIEGGRWKALRLDAPWGDGQWRLFDLQQDPAELLDLAVTQPSRLTRLREGYARYEKRVGVQSVDGPPMAWGFSARFPDTPASKAVLKALPKPAPPADSPKPDLK